MDRKQLGSETAKSGFANERDVRDKFNQWQNDKDAQNWLQIMGYKLEELHSVTAIQIPAKIKKSTAEDYGVTAEKYEEFVTFKKADVQIKLFIQIAGILKIENISLKKAKSEADFNQIDKRSVTNYQTIWKFDDEIAFWLKLFSGETLVNPNLQLPSGEKISQKYPNFINQSLRDNRRIFINEMPSEIQQKILSFFEYNKIIVIADILKGRGGLSADWILVTKLNINNSTTWTLVDINTAMNFYGSGSVKVSPQGSLYIGKIFLQRKGGTPDPTKLQFKFKPCDLFNLTNNDNQ